MRVAAVPEKEAARADSGGICEFSIFRTFRIYKTAAPDSPVDSHDDCDIGVQYR